MADWHYSKGGQNTGPVSDEQLRGMVASGELGPQDLVWREGMGEWQPVTAVPELGSPTIGLAPTAPAPPAAYPAQQQSPYGTPQAPLPVQTLGYQTPMREAPVRTRSDDDMTGVDWLLVVVCPGIGCIVGIMRLIQGKKSAGKMIGFSILFAVIWNIIRFVIALGQQ